MFLFIFFDFASITQLTRLLKGVNMNKLEEFKLYVLKRRDAFEHKYRIGNKTVGDLYRYDLPNNLKYLDDMSQMFIRTLNTARVPLRDKLLTVYVYRYIGHEKYVRRCTNEHDVVTIHQLEKIATKLNSAKAKLSPNYKSPAIQVMTRELNRGERFLASCADFIDKLPEDLFYGWKCSEIYRYYNKKCDVYGLSKFTAYNLATDLAYINELHIELDFINGCSPSMRKMYLEIVEKDRFNAQEYKKFAIDFMKWYLDQPFADSKERIITPNDVGHMLVAYYKLTRGMCKIRYPKKTRVKVSDLVISRSMVIRPWR